MSSGIGGAVAHTALDRALAAVNEANLLLAEVERLFKVAPGEAASAAADGVAKYTEELRLSVFNLRGSVESAQETADEVARHLAEKAPADILTASTFVFADGSSPLTIEAAIRAIRAEIADAAFGFVGGRVRRQIMRQGTPGLQTRSDVLAYVGAESEPIFDGFRLRMSDGRTPGGIPFARCGRTAITDQSYAAGAADSYIAMTRLTVSQWITLPTAASFEPGQALYIADESGVCSGSLTIGILASGSDTIAGQPSILIASPYQKLAFHSNGLNLWTYA